MGTVVRGGREFGRRASRPANGRYARVVRAERDAPSPDVRDVLAALAFGGATFSVLIALGTPVWIGALTASVVGLALLFTPRDDVSSEPRRAEAGIPRVA